MGGENRAAEKGAGNEMAPEKSVVVRLCGALNLLAGIDQGVYSVGRRVPLEVFI